MPVKRAAVTFIFQTRSPGGSTYLFEIHQEFGNYKDGLGGGPETWVKNKGRVKGGGG